MRIPPKTLVFGASGFLGGYLWRLYRLFYPDAIGTSSRPSHYFQYLDLINPDLDLLCIANKGYSYGIITAGITNITACERAPLQTCQSNVNGVLSLAKQLHARKITPVVFSSDYVFDGVMGNYRENDIVNPLNEYGKQKSFLEREISEICEGDFILLRLAKVFGLEKNDNTLIDEIINKLYKKELLKIAYDQIFCPIYVGDVVQAIVKLQIQGCRGVFNVCGSE